MSQVYSTQLVNHAGFSGGPSLEFVVPVGKVVVIRTMSIVHGDVLGSGLDAWFQTSNLTKLCRSTINIGLSPQPNWYGGTDVYAGWWVLNAGDELSIQTAAGTADFHAAGYELSLP